MLFVFRKVIFENQINYFWAVYGRNTEPERAEKGTGKYNREIAGYLNHVQ